MFYHIIWTTYGTWLPGDDRGWMRHGIPAVQPPDPKLQLVCRARMKEEIVLLNDAQIEVVAKTISDHCLKRRWTIFAIAVKTNHVHVLVEADRKGQIVRDQLKAWCSRRLSDQAGLKTIQTKTGGRRRWFTERGYVSQIEDEEYFQEAIAYVENQNESTR